MQSLDYDIVKASQFTLDSDDDEGSAGSPQLNNSDQKTIKDTQLASPGTRAPKSLANGHIAADIPKPSKSANSKSLSSTETQNSTVSVKELLQYMKSNAGLIQETEERLQALLTKQQALSQAEQSMEEDLVVDIISTHLGFHKGRPVAAMLLHRCLLRWGSLYRSHNPFLTRVVDTITLQLSEDEGAPLHPSRQEQMAFMAYWLTNVTVLLQLLHPHLPGAHNHTHDTSSKGSAIRQKFSGFGRRISKLINGPPGANEPPRSRISNSAGHSAPSRVSDHAGTDAASSHADHTSDTSGSRVSPDLERRSTIDEAELGPGSVFRASLESLICSSYRSLRDTGKRRLAPLLGSCMLVQQDTMGRSPFQSLEEAELEGLIMGQSGEEKLLAMRPWCEVVGALNEVLETVKDGFVPRAMLHFLFRHLLSFINAQLFNQLLLRPELCSSANAKFMMEGLNHLDAWLLEVGKEQLGEAYDCLHHIRQAATFLVVENKYKLTVEELSGSVCPSLNPQQLYRLCTTFWDDREGTETVSGEVLEELKREVPNNGGLIVTFLVEEEHTLPFAPGGVLHLEMMGTLDEKELMKGMPIPDMLLSDDVPYEVFGHLEKDLEVC